MTTVIVAIVVFGLVGLAVAKIISDKVRHRGGCSCGGDCSRCCGCHTEKQKP